MSSQMDDDTTRVSSLASSISHGTEDVVDVANDTLDSTRRYGGVNMNGGGGGSSCCVSGNDNWDDTNDNRGITSGVIINDVNIGDADGVEVQLL